MVNDRIMEKDEFFNIKYFVPYKDDMGNSFQKELILLLIGRHFSYFENPKTGKKEIIPNGSIGRMEERD